MTPADRVHDAPRHRSLARASLSATSEVTVRNMRESDWPIIQSIYEAGIATGNATFETQSPAWVGWDANHRRELRFAAVLDERVVGWTAAANVSDRCCYAGVIEDSVYVDPTYQGLGIGTLLLARLIDAATAVGVWTIQAGIFPENAASIALHTSSGFRVVGRREYLGQLNGVWRDVLLLERRASHGVATAVGLTPASEDS
jgi:L-amino acid N-acyltransferase YncA